jgi:hypothetical protein
VSKTRVGEIESYREKAPPWSAVTTETTVIATRAPVTSATTVGTIRLRDTVKSTYALTATNAATTLARPCDVTMARTAPALSTPAMSASTLRRRARVSRASPAGSAIIPQTPPTPLSDPSPKGLTRSSSSLSENVRPDTPSPSMRSR